MNQPFILYENSGYDYGVLSSNAMVFFSSEGYSKQVRINSSQLLHTMICGRMIKAISFLQVVRTVVVASILSIPENLHGNMTMRN